MKRFGFILAFFLVFTFVANAQVHLGVKGGLNLTTVSFKGKLSDNLSSKNQTGFFLGPTVKCSLPLVGLGMDVSALYNQTQAEIEETQVIEEIVSVPVNLRYKPLPVIPVFVFVGPQLDFNLGKNGYDIKDSVLGIDNYNVKDTRFSVNLGAGLTTTHLQLSINYNMVCGKTGELNINQAADAAYNTIVGRQKTNTWQLSAAFFL